MAYEMPQWEQEYMKDIVEWAYNERINIVRFQFNMRAEGLETVIKKPHVILEFMVCESSGWTTKKFRGETIQSVREQIGEYMHDIKTIRRDIPEGDEDDTELL